MSKADQVHNEIMNLKMRRYEPTHDYRLGHRDARHGAAELAMQAVAELEAENQKVSHRCDKLEAENERLKSCNHRIFGALRRIIAIGETDAQCNWPGMYMDAYDIAVEELEAGDE